MLFRSSKRISEGKTEQPIALLASNQIDFPVNWLFFKQPVKRWLLQKEAKNNHNELPNGFHKRINLKFRWRDSLNDLNNEGLSKIVLLGGAKLISSFLIEDLINELQITITPHLLGGSHCWVSSKLNNLNKMINHSEKWILKETKQIGNKGKFSSHIKSRWSEIGRAHV